MYRWGQGPALVQTVDFFTPIVDDPYAYGQIAAANALSDVYAMGGEPRTALAIAAWPRSLPADVVAAIMRGGLDKLTEAGAALLGGHTVADEEIKFGYAVTGEIDPSRMWTNAGARVGDVLVLTKPLGTGIIATALKAGRAADAEIAAAVESMTRLNRGAATAAHDLPATAVSACTDVTGFGLAGHGSEMASASDTTLVIDADALQFLPGASVLAAAHRPGGGRTNEEHFGPGVAFETTVSETRRLIAFDPQTSGGLLLAIDPSQVARFVEQAKPSAPAVGVIGRVTGRERGVMVRFR